MISIANKLRFAAESLKLHEILRFKSKMSPKQIEDLQKKVLESEDYARHGMTLKGHGIELIPEFKERAFKEFNLKKNSDGSYDSDGDVRLWGKKVLVAEIIKDGKFNIKFNHVRGPFICSKSNLTSLKGAPKSVEEDFFCGNNQLTGLEGVPESVGGHFSCDHNNLTSLEGAPKSVGGNFFCGYNNLTSLEGSPKSVGGNFYCEKNPKLTSLEGIGKVRGEIFSDIKEKK